MFHITAHVGLTRWAAEQHPDIRRESATPPGHVPAADPPTAEKPGIWDNFQADFLGHLAEANRSLARAGLPLLDVPHEADVPKRINGVRAEARLPSTET